MSRRTSDGMDRTVERMDRMVNRTIAAMRAGWTESGAPDVRSFGTVDVASDWHAADDAYTLVMDLPGFEREELELGATGGVMTLRAEHAVGDEPSWGTRRVHERVSFPDDADPDGASATYRNGVLEVTFPRLGPDGGDATRIDVE